MKKYYHNKEVCDGCDESYYALYLYERRWSWIIEKVEVCYDCALEEEEVAQALGFVKPIFKPVKIGIPMTPERRNRIKKKRYAEAIEHHNFILTHNPQAIRHHTLHRYRCGNCKKLKPFNDPACEFCKGLVKFTQLEQESDFPINKIFKGVSAIEISAEKEWHLSKDENDNIKF